MEEVIPKLTNPRFRVEKVSRGDFKMNGLVAKVNIPAYTIIGYYPGKIITSDDHKIIMEKIEAYYKENPTEGRFTGDEYSFDADEKEKYGKST